VKLTRYESWVRYEDMFAFTVAGMDGHIRPRRRPS
jgi:hypothetical protein